MWIEILKAQWPLSAEEEGVSVVLEEEDGAWFDACGYSKCRECAELVGGGLEELSVAEVGVAEVVQMRKGRVVEVEVTRGGRSKSRVRRVWKRFGKVFLGTK